MFESLLPILIVVVAVGISIAVFGRVFMRYRNARRLLSTGSLGVADVVSCSQTGVTINSQPEMRVVLNVENVGGTPRQVEIKQVLDLGAIPRAGDRVYVLTDPRNPANVVLAPASTGAQIKSSIAANPAAGNAAAFGQPALTDSQIQDMMALTPELQTTGVLGVVKVVSATPAANGATDFVVDVDAIGQALRRASFTQVVPGEAPAVGARTYVLIDPTNPNVLALVPPSILHGQTLPAGANRLDPLVLGPQLLKAGAKAAGTVLTAKEVPLGDAGLAAKGITKWDLSLTVQPENGNPSYQAPLTISLLNKERADRIAHAGAALPLRYDPLDPQTVSIDSIALGYPDPYADLLKIVQGNVAKG